VDAGMSVTCVTSADEARAWLERSDAGQSVDLVFLNWRLDGSRTRDLLALARSTVGVAPNRVVVVASHADAEPAHASLRALGFGLLLIKPASPSAVFAIVARAFGAEQRSRAGRGAGQLDTVDPSTWDQVRGVRVLLVEDNIINQEVAAAILRSAGVVVELAGNGQDAVTKVHEGVQRNSPFGLVLMDRHMPGMDGLQTTRKIRADSRFADLPIVAMTADVVGSAREECLRAGMNDFISKPFTPDSLFPIVARWAKTKAELPAAMPQPLPATAHDGLLPATLPGLDIQEGLALVGDNRTLYLRLLRTFAATYADADGQLRILLIEGKLDDAIREVHTIKGLAGQMGAQALYRLARRLETALRSASPEVDAALRNFADELALVIRGVAEFLKGDVHREPPDSDEKDARSPAGNETVDHAFP
jgi:two-component system, sensor histidine kinase and response regulator